MIPLFLKIVLTFFASGLLVVLFFQEWFTETKVAEWVRKNDEEIIQAGLVALLIGFLIFLVSCATPSVQTLKDTKIITKEALQKACTKKVLKGKVCGE